MSDTIRLLAALAALAAPIAGCRHDGPVDRALALVDAARSPAGIDPSLVDEPLVEQLRRLQLVRRTTLDTSEPKALLAALAGDAGPDRRYAPAERAQKQRERAARGIQAQLEGPCRGHLDPEARDGRLAFLVAPLAGAPPEVTRAIDEGKRALAGAVAVKIECDKGQIEALLVERGGAWRVVDLFRAGFQNIEVNPSEPTMR